jgi:hypothetical protein
MGLLINVYRPADGHDCTMNGLSSRFATLTLVNAEGPFEATPERPAVVLQSHVPGCLRLVPLELLEQNRWAQFGGNYAACSDSRFRELAEALSGGKFYGAVAVHDRVEG